IDRNDSVAQTYYLLGLVYRDTNRVDEAIAALQHAIKIAPTLAPAREELADLFRAQGRPADEMEELQSLSALDENDDRHVAIALAAARRGQFDAALAALSDVSPAATNASEVQLARGRVYLERAERTLDQPSAHQALAILEPTLATTSRRSENLALV